MKRATCCLVVLVLLPVGSFAEVLTGCRGLESLPIYASEKIGGAVLTRAGCGTSVQVLAFGRGWAHIRTEAGIEGYVEQYQLGDSTPVSNQYVVASQQPPAAATQSSYAPTNPGDALRLEDGTPVKLRLTRTLSSADAKTGDTVDFEVLEEVRLGELLVVPKGGVAWGTVTEAQPKRRMARGGKLNVNIDSVRLTSGEKAALRAVKEGSGGGPTGGMVGGMVVTGIVFFPAAPFFLFMKGKDVTVPKGTEITAYVNGDAVLNAAGFRPRVEMQQQMAALPVTAVAAATEMASLTLSSTPSGADIVVDGKFIGNTPSTAKLPAGDHDILIEKPGFKAWKRVITAMAGGSHNVNAAMESAD